jgi:hypothetical protein
MSDDTGGAGPAKIPHTDPSLLLLRQPKINKKAVRIVLVSFAGVFLAAVIVAYSPKRERTARAGGDAGAGGGPVIRRPSDLTVTPEDYLPRTEPEAIPPEDSVTDAVAAPGGPAGGD